MKQFTVIKPIRFSEKQANSLKVLEDYGVNVSHFIRAAVKEKLQREWKSIKEENERVRLPF